MNREDSIQRFEQYLQRRFPDRHTVRDYLSDIRCFAAACPKTWREVTLADIDAFVDTQREQHSQATVRRRTAALKTFFDFLAEDADDLSWRNPVRFKRHAGKLPKHLPRDLSNDTVERLWHTIESPRDRAWFVLMWRAGLRVGEVQDLKLDNLLSPADADHPARLRVLGKGRKERIVLLSAEAYAVLRDWLDQRPASSQPYVFLNERGGQLTANGIEWLLHRYGDALDLHVTPHQLRHTFARQTLEAGLPLSSLGKLMGHADLDTTLIYTAGADPQLNQAYQSVMTRLAAEPLPPGTPPLQAVAAPSQPPPAPPLPDATAHTTPGLLPDSSPPQLEPPPIAALRPPPLLPDWDAWAADWPEPIRQACLQYVQRRAGLLPPQRQRIQALKLLGDLRRFWDWQLTQRPISQLAELHLADLHAYQSARLAQGRTPATVNRHLSYVITSLREQAEGGIPVDDSIFRLRHLKAAPPLPRCLPEADCLRLEVCARQRLSQPDLETRLETACFFVLAHTGLRASECVQLQTRDLDLSGQRLTIRAGKGHKDRTVYLSDLACQALRAYLGETPRPSASALWVHANGRPLSYRDLLDSVAALGQAAGVANVTPHRLRHSLATRLLNAGMDITRIQKLLGHTELKTTMAYAQVLDLTLEADYRQAMSQIERRQPPLSTTPELVANWPMSAGTEAASRTSGHGPTAQLVGAANAQPGITSLVRAIDNSV